MDASRARRLLLIAFAVSLVLHALLALRMNWPFARPRDEPQVVTLEHRVRIATIRKATPTPPPQTPAPTAAPVASVAPIRAPKKTTSSRGLLPAGGAPRAATPPPTPVPTIAAQGSACTKPETNPTLVTPPTPPDLAPGVRASATNAVVRVRVKLDERAAVTDASVEQSSGNGSLDLVAVSMARGGQYAPAYHNCKAIAGTYTFSARFIPW